MFEEVVRLINYIGELHKSFSEYFFSGHVSFNLKRTEIEDIIGDSTYDENFILLLDDYIEELSLFLIFNVFASKSQDVETRMRNKVRESVLNKIFYYRSGDDKGKIAVQKSLNDLLGFRIVLNTRKSYEELFEEIRQSDDVCVSLFRPYIRKDEEYSAIHIYFKSDDNRYFPWELQIWKQSDAVSNENSHRNHKEKRKYINWTEIYKDNKHREE